MFFQYLQFFIKIIFLLIYFLDVSCCVFCLIFYKCDLNMVMLMHLLLTNKFESHFGHQGKNICNKNSRIIIIQSKESYRIIIPNLDIQDYLKNFWKKLFLKKILSKTILCAHKFIEKSIIKIRYML